MVAHKKIKICHLSLIHPVYHSRIFYKECFSLKTDYDVHYIVKHKCDEGIEEVKIHALPLRKQRWKRFLLNGPLLLKKAIDLKADIYHFHNPELIPYMLLLKKKGSKIIYDIHENVQADILLKEWLPFRKQVRQLYLYFENKAVKYFDLVLAEESYVKFYQNRTHRITVIQNFVNTDMILPAKAAGKVKNTVLVVGNLAGARGLPAILEALLLLKNQNIIVQLQCVGEKDDRVKNILKHSKAYPFIKEQLFFKGFKRLPDAYKDIENCFAGLALPEDSENHRESYPTKMFEYMAAGLAVICSDFPINRAVVDKHNCGIAVDPSDVKALADAIFYLFQNLSKAEKMGENGRKAAEEEYNWKYEEEKLLQLYTRILAK